GMGIEKQPAIDTNDAARCGKGVELWVVDDDEGQAVVLQFAVQGQVVGDVHQVVVKQWIGDGLAAGTYRAQKLTAQAILIIQRNQAGNPVPQCWQLHLCQGIAGGQGSTEQGGHRGTGDAATQCTGNLSGSGCLG